MTKINPENTILTEIKEAKSLPQLKTVKELPQILPNDMSKKDLFNKIQDTTPISGLVGVKEFKILGMIPELVNVPRTQIGEEEQLPEEFILEEDNLVERLRLTIITENETYHSFSETLNKAIVKGINIYGVEFLDNKFTLVSKTKQTPGGLKNYYVLTII